MIRSGQRLLQDLGAATPDRAVAGSVLHRLRYSPYNAIIAGPDGEIIAASSRQSTDRISLSTQELRDAAAGRIGTAVRASRGRDEKILYTALAVPGPAAGTGGEPEATVAFLILYAPLADLPVFTAIEPAGGLAVVLFDLTVAAVFAFFLAGRVSRPLEELLEGIHHFTRNRFIMARRFRNCRHSFREIGRLSQAIEQMADNLSRRITDAERQNSELEAVFSSMVEAVIMVDSDGRLVNINRAAQSLFNLENEKIRGKRFIEAVRNADLHRFVQKSLAADDPIEEEILLQRDNNDTVFLQAHGVLIKNSGAQRPGALIVLNDVTRLRRLESLRKDFVANVSHELKTPITTIKGFVETLRDGAIDDEKDAGHFLEIILKHADRLNAIVEDLLTLSRIEQEDESAEIIFERASIREILLSAMEACSMKAAEKGIRFVVNCQDDHFVTVNSHLLEQAVTNLLINAVKYSDADNQVIVRAWQDSRWHRIEVTDFGIGIDKKHLPRLFERFYRSDKARSRKLGGTGLGLAIVKHIMRAHQGEVTVNSEIGQGTTFTISLPVPLPTHRQGGANR